MSQSVERLAGGRVTNMVQQRPATAGQAGTSTVTLRKSCDLCVRLKRACDGTSPCNLCTRRREPCTRSIKRKSGPAKGTKYTTRRQRLEAGIPDPPRTKRKSPKPKPKTESAAAAAAVAAVTAAASSGADASSIVVPGEDAGAGGGGRRVSNVAHNSAAKRMQKNRKAPNVQQGGTEREVVSASPRGHVHTTSTVGREEMIAVTAAAGFAADSSNGSGGSGSNVIGSRGRNKPPEADEEDVKRETGTSVRINCVALPQRSSAGGFFGAADGGSVPHNSRGRGEGSNGGVGDSGMDVVPRRSMSPISMPVLQWPSPSLPPSAGAPNLGTPTSAGGGPLEGGGGGGGDMSRGRSTSPFGLLPGPPAPLAGRPRRGGTREPPVGPEHYRAPVGAGTKRYRLSPPFSTRDMSADQRGPSEGNIEMSLTNGAVQSDGVGNGEGAGLRAAARRTPRDHVGGSPFSSGQLFSPSSSYAPSGDVSSFNSLNALGPILDRRRGHASSSRPANGGNEENHGEFGDALPVAYGRQQQQQQGWEQQGIRLLPHPTSASGVAESRLSSLGGDPSVNRWHQLENAGSRANLEGTSRGRDPPAGGAGRFEYQLHRPGESGEYVGSGVVEEPGGGSGSMGNSAGVGRSGAMESTRDLNASTGGHVGGGGWNVGNSNASSRTALTHVQDDDVTGVQSRGWGVVDPCVGGGSRKPNGARGGGNEDGAWPFNINAIGGNTGVGVGMNPTGVGGGIVGDGSDSGGSDLGPVGLSSATVAVAAAVSNGSGPAGVRDPVSGGVWPEDSLALPSPPASPAAKIALQKRQQQQGHARAIAMPLPTTSGTGVVGDRNGGSGAGGGGGGSPFFVGPQYRGAGGMSPPTMMNFRGRSVASIPSPWQQPAPGSGSALRNPAGSIADSRATGGTIAWVNDAGGNGDGSSEPFMDGGVSSARDSSLGRSTGHGAWSTWGPVPGKRGGFDRDAPWPAEYTI